MEVEKKKRPIGFLGLILTGLTCGILIIALVWYKYSPAPKHHTLALATTVSRLGVRLDSGWKFLLDQKQASDSVYPPQCVDDECKIDFDDSFWPSVTVPHDFVVNGTFQESADMAHGYLPYGSGWYRIPLNLNADDLAGKDVWIEFEGSQRDTWVYLNENLICSHKSGYTPFFCPVSLSLLAAKNILAVHVNATQPDGWWYDGGGLYRNVWLRVASPVRVAQWGLYATSDITNIQQIPNGTVGDALINLQVTITNNNKPSVSLQDGLEVNQRFNARHLKSATFLVIGDLFDSDGEKIGSVASKAVTQEGADVTITMPPLPLQATRLWDLTTPRLLEYQVQILDQSGNSIDSSNVTFGLRTIRFDKATGFYLNEVPMKIKGMANHQDFCGVGVAVPDSMQEYRVKTLLNMGANGWRTAHNPPTVALLDECDKQGMLVWDENHRNIAEGEDWINDVKTLIMRDRNHPSVIMWSICNEVLCENFNATSAALIRDVMRQYDTTRPITAAMNGGYETDFWKALDVVGINYHVPQYDVLNNRFPRPLIGSETSSALSDRSQYANDPSRAYVSAYDTNYPDWGNTAEGAWCPIHVRDYMSGGFVWTGYDYKGEPTPYQWPNINSHFGVIDICGFDKDHAMYYRSVWRPEPQLHVLPHWTWTEDNCYGACSKVNGNLVINVWAYSNSDQVELLINGQSQGIKSMPASGCEHLEWNVTYAPGRLEVRSYAKGSTSPVQIRSAVTAARPSSISLTPDFQNNPLNANGQDVIVLRAAIVDNMLNFVPTAAVSLRFTVTGPAKIIGLGNGDPSSHERDKPLSDQFGQRTSWNGLARVIVQTTNQPGDITITAEGIDRNKTLTRGRVVVRSV